MTNPMTFFATLGLMGLGCALAYSLMGSSVAPDGALVEPFFLIPIGYLLMALGFGGTLIITLSRLIRGTLRPY